MSSNKNKHGLSRTIREDVKLQIRQNSKFGCVICRAAIYTYEHIEPVFVDAKEHDPDNMCLLCPNHQAESTSGVLSKNRIKAMYSKIRNTSADKAAKTKQALRGVKVFGLSRGRNRSRACGSRARYD